MDRSEIEAQIAALRERAVKLAAQSPNDTPPEDHNEWQAADTIVYLLSRIDELTQQYEDIMDYYPHRSDG